MTLNPEEKWACWNALVDGIANVPDAITIPKRAVISALRKLTAELGGEALKRLDDRIAHERIHNVTGMYALMDAKKAIT